MSTSISTPVRNPTHADGRCKTFDRTSKRLKNFCQDIPTGSLREQSPYCETVTSDDEIDVELNFGVDGEFDSSHCDDDFDTDLEGEEDKHIYDASGRATYISACNECGVVPASYYLRHMKDSSLEMHHHGVGVKGARAMAIALVTNTFVLNLNLSDNGLGQEGVHHICNMLKENCYITDLDLSENKIGLEGVSSITDVLVNTNNLKSLILQGNELDSKAASILAEGIAGNTSMKCLDLSHNSLDEQAGVHLGPAIAANDCLDTLNLSWNHLRHKGAYSIALSLKENNTLKVLDLSWNGFADDGAFAVGEGLKENSSLLELNLSNNRITKDGASKLNKGLMLNETLKVLRLGQNPMQSEGAFLILMAVKNNTNIALIEVELLGIQVNDDFYSLLHEISDTYPALKVLHGGAGGAPGKADARPKPMKVLKNYVKQNRMRLFDFFSMMDKDKSMSLTVSELVNGLRETGIPLTSEELLVLVKELDKDRDGEIDYRAYK